MTEVVTAPAPSAPTEEDRSVALRVFGIVQLLLGALCVFLVMTAAAGSELAARRGFSVPQQAFASALLVYGGAALYFVATGVGSIRQRVRSVQQRKALA